LSGKVTQEKRKEGKKLSDKTGLKRGLPNGAAGHTISSDNLAGLLME
jgi:hypothetical protein